MTAALIFQMVSVAYARKLIIDEFSLTVPSGQITAIIGPNGCGKSTLLKAVCRMMPCQSGSITLFGKNVRSYTHKEFARQLAILTQSHTAPPDLLVRDLVALGRFPYRSFYSGFSKEDEAAILEALEATRMSDLADRLVSTLSGGEKQRAWIAMALAQRPKVLLLDEPTTYLDISHQLEIMQLLRRLNQQTGLTILLVLHDLNQAIRFTDQVAVMKEGRLVTSGPTAKTITASLLQQVFGVKVETFVDAEGVTALIPMDLCK
jgi:iron complex transport system ATP-binding protein